MHASAFTIRQPPMLHTCGWQPHTAYAVCVQRATLDSCDELHKPPKIASAHRTSVSAFMKQYGREHHVHNILIMLFVMDVCVMLETRQPHVDTQLAGHNTLGQPSGDVLAGVAPKAPWVAMEASISCRRSAGTVSSSTPSPHAAGAPN